MSKSELSWGTLLVRRDPQTPPKNFDRQTCLRVVGLLALLTLSALPLLAADPDQLYRDRDYRAAQKAYGELDLKHPQTVRYRYNRGCAAYQAGDYQAASAAFKSSLTRATDDELRYRCNFNLGNTAFKQGDYQAAASYYRQGLRLRPGDEGLKVNLELALRRLAERQKQPNQPQPQAQKQPQQPGQQPDQKPQQPNQAGQPPQAQPPAQNAQRPQSGQNQPGQSPAQNQAGQKQTQSGPPPPPQGQPGQVGAARSAQSALDRQRAAALIESVREKRPPRSGSGQLPASGKYW